MKTIHIWCAHHKGEVLGWSRGFEDAFSLARVAGGTASRVSINIKDAESVAQWLNKHVTRFNPEKEEHSDE